jgi:hypothetical protein
MLHLYQPVMIRELLTKGGIASIRDIASAFLARDESQLEYYEQITKRMPSKVLANHGVVERSEESFRLAVENLSDAPSINCLDGLRGEIVKRDLSVSGFNVGANSGESAGQTVGYAHLHLIPRRQGDVEDPRGGVRGVIPGKADY